MADNNLGGLGDETLANAQGISRAMSDIAASSRSLTRELGQGATSYTNFFNTVQNSANKVADIQNNALKTHKATNQALGEQTKQLNTVRTLNVQISSLMTESAKLSNSRLKSEKERGALLKIQAELLVEARDNAKDLASVYGRIASDASKLDGKTRFFSGLSEIAKSIPILNKLATPFEKASEAARKVAVEKAKFNKVEKVGLMYRDTTTGRFVSREYGEAAMAAQKKSGFKEAAKAAGGELLSTMTSMTSIAGMLSVVVKFIVDIFLQVNRQVIQIAKNLGTSVEAAGALFDRYNKIANAGSNILMDTQAVIDAQVSLVDSLGVYSDLQDSTLRNQVFFTKNLTMSADAAADLNLMFEAQGQNAEKMTDRMNETNNAVSKATGRMVPFDKLASAVAKTSKQIAGYFGFNAVKIAEGVRQMSKFGLELSNAATVSKSLLDFETSIGNELTLELLTGKEFNLERARTKAVTGDIAGATNDVLEQMQNLTEEQRKNPLIMESMAALSGLTADELNRAYLVNKKLTKEGKDYVAELQKAGKEKEVNQVRDEILRGQTIQQIKDTISAQDAFAAALNKVKDKLAGLVDKGVLDKFTSIIEAFVTTVTQSGFGGLFSAFGKSEFSQNLEKIQGASLTEKATPKNGVNPTKLNDLQKEAIERMQRSEQAVEMSKGTNMLAFEEQRLDAYQAQQIREGRATIGKKGEIVPGKGYEKYKDTGPDTYAGVLVEKMGEWFENLTTAVRGEKHIYIGATAVNESIGVHTNKVGAK